MTGPRPIEKANEYFNQLAILEFDDTKEAFAIAQELSLLVRKTQGDFTARVAYAQALLQSGQRDTAVEQLDTAYGLRDRFDRAPMERLAGLMMFVSDLRAIEVMKQIAFNRDMIDTTAASNHSQIAAWSMDVALLQELYDLHKSMDVPSTASIFMDVIKHTGNLDELRIHQRALIDLLKPYQVGLCFSVVNDDGDWLLTNNVFFDSSKIERRALEDMVDEKLEDCSPAVVDRVIRIFTPAPSAPPKNVFSLNSTFRSVT